MNKHPDFVQKMIDEPGFYTLSHPDRPAEMVPIFSLKGELFSLQIDSQLDPTGFGEGLTLQGPLKFLCHQSES